MIQKQAALICALVLSVSMANASETKQATSTWEKGSIPDKGYHFFAGIGKDIKAFFVTNKIIDDNNISKTNTADK